MRPLVLPDDYETWCPCGRKMVFRLEQWGYDRATGEPNYRRILKCPRFDRQWRNLWFGGLSHEGVDLDTPMLSLVWK